LERIATHQLTYNVQRDRMGGITGWIGFMEHADIPSKQLTDYFTVDSHTDFQKEWNSAPDRAGQVKVDEAWGKKTLEKFQDKIQDASAAET